MPIDFTGQKYVTPDSAFEIDLGALPMVTWLNAFGRVADHVTGNETVSKVLGLAKVKSVNEIDPDERARLTQEVRQKFLDAMLAGTWGEKGNRGPRTPGVSRLDQIIRNITAEDTRRALAKEGYKAGEKKDTWTAGNGEDYGLDDWMTAYIEHPELGAERKASIEARAKIKYDAELADAEARKAAREREAKVGKGSGLVL